VLGMMCEVVWSTMLIILPPIAMPSDVTFACALVNRTSVQRGPWRMRHT
jgi:hypothetical protein